MVKSERARLEVQLDAEPEAVIALAEALGAAAADLWLDGRFELPRR